jgi:two-component system, OmpR family, response regulator RegX3
MAARRVVRFRIDFADHSSVGLGKICLLEAIRDAGSLSQVCRRTRAQGNLAVIMLPARVSEIESVVALQMGADHCLTEPFGSHELVARIGALLRSREPA